MNVEDKRSHCHNSVNIHRPLLVLVTHLVIGHLLQKQVCLILDGHSRVAVIVAVVCCPGEPNRLKRIDPLVATLRAKHAHVVSLRGTTLDTFAVRTHTKIRDLLLKVQPQMYTQPT